MKWVNPPSSLKEDEKLIRLTCKHWPFHFVRPISSDSSKVRKLKVDRLCIFLFPVICFLFQRGMFPLNLTKVSSNVTRMGQTHTLDCSKQSVYHVLFLLLNLYDIIEGIALEWSHVSQLYNPCAHHSFWRPTDYRLVYHISCCTLYINITQIGCMVLQLLWKLILVGWFRWNNFPVFAFFQHGTIPVIGAHRSEKNTILKENMDLKGRHYHPLCLRTPRGDPRNSRYPL